MTNLSGILEDCVKCSKIAWETEKLLKKEENLQRDCGTSKEIVERLKLFPRLQGLFDFL
jgi:hypothetical protein